MKKTQKEIVIEHLKKNKYFDPVQAFHIGMLRLGAVIHELKADGWNIDGTYLRDKKTKKVNKYKSYYLKRPYKLF